MTSVYFLGFTVPIDHMNRIGDQSLPFWDRLPKYMIDICGSNHQLEFEIICTIDANHKQIPYLFMIYIKNCRHEFRNPTNHELNQEFIDMKIMKKQNYKMFKSKLTNINQLKDLQIKMIGNNQINHWAIGLNPSKTSFEILMII